jgi:uncharacterized protein with ATP-grasp and redox domains
MQERSIDRVLIESLRDRGRKTAVVKGSPVINDATLDDASAAGLRGAVIDNAMTASVHCLRRSTVHGRIPVG